MSADSNAPTLRRRYEDRFRSDLERFFRRLSDAATDGGFHVDTFLAALEGIVFSVGKATATAFGERVYAQLTGRSLAMASLRFDADLMDNWIAAVAANTADSIIDATAEGFDEAFASGDPEMVTDYAEGLVSVRSGIYAVSLVTTFANFGANDGARAAEAGRKTWLTTSSNPRESHAAIGGETVALDERFSNGLLWPGDPAGPAEELANCVCALEFA